MSGCAPIRLIAFDEEDLAILSSHLQDALFVVADLARFSAGQALALGLRRFVWEACPDDESSGPFFRRASGLRFSRVLRVQSRGFGPRDREQVLQLLSVHFVPADEPPAGTIFFTFAGEARLRLDVECIEAELRDLDEQWPEAQKPCHDPDAPQEAS